MKTIAIALFGIFFILTTTALLGDDKPMNAKMEITKLTLFKNGLGFIVSTAALPKNAAEVRIGQLPIPSFGTFWVGYPKTLALKSLVTSMEDRETSVPAQSLGELLKLNAGHKVVVHTADRDIEGTVLAEPAAENPDAAGPYFMDARSATDRYNRQAAQYPDSDVIVIKTSKGTVAVSAAAVLRVDFADESIARADTVNLKVPSIRLKLNKPAADEKVTVSYLARGVTWSPSYLIDLSDPKTAKFSAHAVVINEMTDFKNVKLQLVTGFPNIKFGEVLNPVAKAQTLAEFIAALSGAGQGRSSGLMNQQMLVNQAASYRDDSDAFVPGYSTAVEGQSTEDLFFYPITDFSLNKDETAWVPLFSTDMPYKHVYTWSIGDFLDQGDTYRSGSQAQPAPEEVWHSCRLTNTLAMPLTTAAAEFTTDGEFTGQDVCYYTPSKGETTIHINKALNVQAEQAEIEVERKRNATTIQGYNYDAVKLRGELQIKNKTGKTISVEITKELSGELIENAQKAKDVKTTKGLKQVNPKHLLKWEIDLKPGEEQKLTYQYQLYIRN